MGSEGMTDAPVEEKRVCAGFCHVDEFCELFGCRRTLADIDVEGKRWENAFSG